LRSSWTPCLYAVAIPAQDAAMTTLSSGRGIKHSSIRGDIEAARIWYADFVNWYNKCHRHSVLAYVTPIRLFSERNKTILAARERNPLRWIFMLGPTAPHHGIP